MAVSTARISTTKRSVKSIIKSMTTRRVVTMMTMTTIMTTTTMTTIMEKKMPGISWGRKKDHIVFVSWDADEEQFWVIDSIRRGWSKSKVSYFADVVVLGNPIPRSYKGIETVEGELLYLKCNNWTRFFNSWVFSLRYKWLRDVWATHKMKTTIEDYINGIHWGGGRQRDYALFIKGNLWL